MISGQNIFENGFFYWGSGTAGQSFVLQSTGLSPNGVTLWRLVPGSAGGDVSALIDDETGDILVDDATGQILHDG